MESGVVDDQRLAGGDDVLAEGMGERRLASAGPGFGQADAALEELPFGVHERDQGHGAAEECRGQPCQPVEGGLGRAVEQAGAGEGGQAGGILEDGRQFGLQDRRMYS